MARMKKDELARYEGMAYALRIAKKDGIEALEEEIKKRGISGISLNVSHKELEAAGIKMRNMMFDTFLCFSIGILHDKYSFGPKRAQEFKDYFLEGSKLLEDGTISWQQVIDNTEDALKMKLSIRENIHDTRIERIY